MTFWYGPALILWVMTVLPFVFIPMWVHPLVSKDSAARREFKRFALKFLVLTWLIFGTVASLASPNWAGWVWLGTEVFLAVLIYKSVRLRVVQAREKKRVDREFQNLIGGL